MGIEYTAKNMKRWSLIGERPTFGLALYELAKENEDIIVVAADTIGSAGLERMRNALPEQVINVGIAEQNMMGIAAGIASEGYTVFTTTFAPFQSMRCLEQIRVNQGYMGQKVVMVGLASGVAYGELGYTHCAIEDAGILRAIPNIAVVAPADCIEVVKTIEMAVSYDHSVYIRLLDKTNVPMVYQEDFRFEIGKAIPLIREGEVAILANGTMVYPAMKAVERMKEESGKTVALFDFHTIKPLDTECLFDIGTKVSAILTIEEHSLIGGLGSAISEYYADKKNHPLIYRMGFQICMDTVHLTIQF